MGLVYLIQNEELLGTRRYKIGMSSKDNLSRLQSYKKNSRYLGMFSTKDYLYLENKLKQIFNERFTLIAGKEFFEGDEEYIISTFFEVISAYITKRTPKKEKLCKCQTEAHPSHNWKDRFAYKIENNDH